MSIYSGLELRQVPLFLPHRRREWEAFLRSHDLEPSEPLIAAGLYDADDRLRGCASLCRLPNALSVQCVAMDADCGESGQVARLIDFLKAEASEIVSQTGALGATDAELNLLLFTKPEYEPRFRALAFHTVARAADAVMLESSPRALHAYTDYLRSCRRAGTAGAIVMNANPCTRGHLYLIEQAAAKVDNLYILPVLDDTEGGFPYALRRRMLVEATAHLDNVDVLQGSRYAVSAATFPTYFIKTLTRRTDTHIHLDLDIFIRHIAPALGATVRFIGTEPADALTHRYNALMSELLPPAGIEVLELDRLREGAEVISATAVRAALKHHDFPAVLSFLPPSSQRILLADMGVRALLAELDTDPKPGLVTPTSAGAHTDMDYVLMLSAIEAIRPWLERMAESPEDHDALVHLGLEAEKAMLQATGGVNTHKGAIFALGIMIAAFARIWHTGNISPASLSTAIRAIAAPFAPAKNHGSLLSALAMAKGGYPQLFADWLPFLRSLSEADSLRYAKLLLRIMSTLDDTNIHHRGGLEALQWVKERAAALENDFSEERYADFCTEMQTRNLSPGGAADMLALTLLADYLLPLKWKQ